MNNVVQMAVLQSTSDLPCKLSRHSLSQPAMADDIIQHLSTVDVFENHVVVVLVDDHFAHSANIRVVEEHGEGGFA